MKASDIIKTHRVFNQWADQALYYDQYNYANMQMRMLDDYLDHPRFTGLKYKYFSTPGNKEYQKMYREVPLKNILNYANTMMRPVFTDFTEVNENEEFMAISGKFFYELFIQEDIYVSYNIFRDETDVILPTGDGDMEKQKQTMDAIRYKGGFDIWVKLDKDEYSKNIEFMHIDTGLVVKFPDWRNQLANCKWSAIPQDNLSNWCNIAGIELALTKYLDQCILTCGKKIIFTTQGQSDAQKEQFEEMLNSFKNYFHFNLKNQADIEPIIAFEGDDLVSIRDTIFQYLDRMKFEYGRVANTNPKGERITSGENYKDISAIANRQKETLEYLILFKMQVKRLWGIELDFAVSGIPEKESIYSVSHLAQNPNMEKEMFGQIEAAGDRKPIGEKGNRKVNKTTAQWSH